MPYTGYTRTNYFPNDKVVIVKNINVKTTQLGLDIDGILDNKNSGYSVSMNASGDRVAIGGMVDTYNKGSTRIYQWNGLTWTQMGDAIDGENDGDQSGYSVSLNALGDYVAMGSPYIITGEGYVRIYKWNGTNWEPKGDPILGVVSDYSGRSVSLNASGDCVAIGAPDADASKGYVRIHKWGEDGWAPKGDKIGGGTKGDQSGWCVSLNASGDYVAIGSPQNSADPVGTGYVQIHEWGGTDWKIKGAAISGVSTDDKSGWSVSLNALGDCVAMGAPYGNTSKGYVRIFKYKVSAWVPLGQKIEGNTINGITGGDRSGWSVSLNALGDCVAIGSPQNASETSTGHTKIYKLNGTTWTQFGSNINGESAGDKSGFSVSMNALGDRFAIGAYQNDPTLLLVNAGNTKIYKQEVCMQIGSYFVCL